MQMGYSDGKADARPSQGVVSLDWGVVVRCQAPQLVPGWAAAYRRSGCRELISRRNRRTSLIGCNLSGVQQAVGGSKAGQELSVR